MWTRKSVLRRFLFMSIACKLLRPVKNSDGWIRCDLVCDARFVVNPAIDTDACDVSFLEDFCCGLEFCFKLLTWLTIWEWLSYV
jgi:hypothetical protein